LPPVTPKHGKQIPEDIKSLVNAFYNQDEVSRACPGINDCVTVKNPTTSVGEKKQRRFFLMFNIRDIFQMFKERYPHVKIGLSSFFSLRPQECKSLSSKGYQNVCLCAHHKNVKLLYRAVKINSVKPYMSMLMCEEPSKDWFFRRCSECALSSTNVEREISALLIDLPKVSYKRWLTTDGTQFVQQESSSSDFSSLVANETELLLKHHCISKSQQNFLNQLKAIIPEDELIICGEFAEKYSPVIQDSIQADYFSHCQVTLHPFNVYWGMKREIGQFYFYNLYKYSW